MSTVWKPSVTVAAVIERDGRFLLVEEEAEGALVFNQPAGHWERGETLASACAREALEESGHAFAPRALVGVYRWHYAPADTTFLRFAFCGELIGHDSSRELDREILRAVWMTSEEIRAVAPRHRSPLVQRCVDDYIAGRRYPADLIVHCE